MKKWLPLTFFALAISTRAEGPSLTVENLKVTVRTSRVIAVFDGPALISVRGIDQPAEFADPKPPAQPLDLVYMNWSRLGQDKHQTTTVRKLSDLAAMVTIKGADSTRSLLIAADPATGDVCVSPDGISNRRGVRTVQWRFALHPQATAILPVINGTQIKPGTDYPGSGWFVWPQEWNAQLAIIQSDSACLMVHCQDTSLQYKSLQLHRDKERTELGFGNETPGPLSENRTAGGIEWRLNVYKGDWKVPAGRYREWMQKTYQLAGKRAGRPAWVDQVSLAVCWAGANEAMLDALAEVHPPGQTLIHLSEWRRDKYDHNYPDYTPAEKVPAYMAKAAKLGFHVMPHFNYFAVYYQHPFFQEVRDFQMRSPDTMEPQGWHWPPETHDYTRMAYIHPGLGLLRNQLVQAVTEACDRVGAHVAFLDQTLCTWNTDNGLVQGMNAVAGMRRLHEQFNQVRPDLMLVGEGLNEISFQRQCFAQAHIRDVWGSILAEDKHVEAAHPLCSFLWSGHTRLIGYHHLNPRNADCEKVAELYHRMGAIPTLIVSEPNDLKTPAPVVQRTLERARQASGTP